MDPHEDVTMQRAIPKIGQDFLGASFRVVPIFEEPESMGLFAHGTQRTSIRLPCDQRILSDSDVRVCSNNRPLRPFSESEAFNSE
jgi:hypothetical protein